MNEMERFTDLADIIRQHSAPLFPIRADLAPEWEALLPKDLPLWGIKACIFDLYGTLFVSGAGEIGAADAPPGKSPAVSPHTEDPAIAAMKVFFRGAVTAFHKQAKAAGKTFPEIRVEEIWAGYDGPIPENWGQARSAGERALLYELAVNPVYPMPGAAETIGKLKDSGLVLGVISNAQFFSPLLFEAFFGKSPREMGFDPRLLIWSFEEGEAKPSARLFEKAVKRLEERGIQPGETVYVGNDMKNDILPAAAAGFKTVLFAGDLRSLRLRDMLPSRKKTAFGEERIPSLVIRDLQSLPGIR